MFDLKVEYLLLFLIAIFLFYSLLNCGCRNGFSVGGEIVRPICKGTLSNECNTYFNCDKNYVKKEGLHYQCKSGLLGFCEWGDDGQSCQTCTDSDCNNKGTATGDKPNCNCNCKSGWTGDNCNTPSPTSEKCKKALKLTNCIHNTYATCEQCAGGGENQIILEDAGCRNNDILNYCKST